MSIMSYPASRLRFFKGQLLRSIDLGDQETFHFEQAALHDRTAHFWGIVEGLSVAIASNTTKLTIYEGAAVDALGHPILVPVQQGLTSDNLTPGQTYKLVVTFHERPTDAAPPGFTDGHTRL